MPVLYRHSAVERLYPGRTVVGWEERCCRSPWRYPGTPSRSMACAYWLNGNTGDKRRIGLNGAIRRGEKTWLFVTAVCVCVWEDVCVCVCVRRYTYRQIKDTHTEMHTLKPHPRPLTHPSSVTPHLASVGNIITPKPISPYHTGRGILHISIRTAQAACPQAHFTHWQTWTSKLNRESLLWIHPLIAN